MTLCGDCERELSSHEATYERALEADVVGKITSILEVCSVITSSSLLLYVLSL